jgi:hypothetical protein
LIKGFLNIFYINFETKCNYYCLLRNEKIYEMKNILLLILAFIVVSSCSNQKIHTPITEKLESNTSGSGLGFEIEFLKGKHHNHPTFVFWVEDLEGNYIETLFVTQYIGTGIFGHGSLGEGKWSSEPGEAKRPASLPYWLHKRGIMADGKTYLPTPEQPIADAITGATPLNDFKLSTRSSDQLPAKFRLMMEINQTWDWNEFWNNGLYPEDANYKTSCQPALVYSVVIDQAKSETEYYLNPIGHSHHSGKDGELYTDLTTITTAKEIAHKITVTLNK